MDDEKLNSQFKAMIEQESAIINAGRLIANLYNSLIESGLPEHIALDLVKNIIQESINININKSE